MNISDVWALLKKWPKSKEEWDEIAKFIPTVRFASKEKILYTLTFAVNSHKLVSIEPEGMCRKYLFEPISVNPCSSKPSFMEMFTNGKEPFVPEVGGKYSITIICKEQ